MIQSWFANDLMAAFKGFLLERLELARFFSLLRGEGFSQI